MKKRNQISQINKLFFFIVFLFLACQENKPKKKENQETPMVIHNNPSDPQTFYKTSYPSPFGTTRYIGMIGNRNAVLYLTVNAIRAISGYMGVLYFIDDYKPILLYGQMSYFSEYDESIKRQINNFDCQFGGPYEEKNILKDGKYYKRFEFSSDTLYTIDYSLSSGQGVIVNDSLYEGYWSGMGFKEIPFKFVSDTSANILKTSRLEFIKSYKVNGDKWIEINKNSNVYNASLYFHIPIIKNDTNMNRVILSLFYPTNLPLNQPFSLTDIDKVKHLYFDTFRIVPQNRSYTNLSSMKYGEIIYQDDNFLGVFLDDYIELTPNKNDLEKNYCIRRAKLYTIDIHKNKIIYFDDIFRIGSEKDIKNILVNKYNNLFNIKNLDTHNFMLTKKGIYFLYERVNGFIYSKNSDQRPIEVFLTYEEVKQFMKK